MRFGRVLFVLFVLSVLSLSGFQARAQSSSLVTPVTGAYVEVRANHVFTCGCFYSGELVTAGKEAILAWKIRTGSHSGISLEGLKAVAVVVGPDHLSIEGVPRRTALYLDGISSVRQQKAAVALLQEHYSDVLGQIVTFHQTPINFQSNGDSTTVEIPEIARLELRQSRLPEDAHLGSALWYDPYIPVTSSQLSTVEHDEYWGDDFSRRWRRYDTGISGYTAEFALR